MASGSYSEYTQDAFLIELARRLYDSTEQFWSRAEKRLYLAEALRWWNSLTGYWRGDFVFNSQANVQWYDLTDTSSVPTTLRALTLRDTDLYNIVQFILLEPLGMNPWVGSAQYVAQDLLSSFQRRRDEVLGASGVFLTRRTIGAVAGRILLPETIIDVRRMAYLPLALTNQPNSVMWPADAWGEQSYNPYYLQSPPGTPQTYLVSTQPPLSFDVDTPPAYAGSYEILSVEAGGTAAVGAPSALNIPDDFMWVLKYAMLADLFNQESNAKDALRASHAEKLYRMGLALLDSAPAILQMRLGNVPIPVDSARAEDLYKTSWQSESAAQPTRIVTAGLNLFAMAPVPDVSTYSLTASVVTNAPVPADDTKFIQMGRDDADIILDLCVHIAMTKVGGAEMMDTMPLLERFLRSATLYNRKLNEIAEYRQVLSYLSQREQAQNPRMEPETGDAANA